MLIILMARGVVGSCLLLALTTLPKLPVPNSIVTSYLSMEENTKNLLFII